MDVRVSSLREGLRNAVGLGPVLAVAFGLVLPACANLVGLESSQSESQDPTGSPKPASELPPDETLPAPPPTDCGDRSSNPNNCGWCGHSCGQGASCGQGLCSQTVVVQAPTVRAFVSDGLSLWMIADKSPVRCRADGPVTQVCDPVVRAEDVDARLSSLDIEIGGPWGGGGGSGGNGNNGGQGNGGGKGLLGSKPLDARAITRERNHIVITDDAYHAVLACPLSGSCTAQNLAIVDARAKGSFEETRSFGRSIASGPTSTLSWSQGDALFANLLPADGTTVRADLSRENDLAVAGIERIVAPAGIFWISPAGLHHAPSVNAQPERWSARVSTDLAVDTESVYVAGKDGLFRMARTNRGETVAAVGEFTRVASDGSGLYATKPKPNGGGTAIVEVRKGQLLEIAVVPGAVDSLVVVGNQLYFQTRVGNVDEIRRVAR